MSKTPAVTLYLWQSEEEKKEKKDENVEEEEEEDQKKKKKNEDVVNKKYTSCFDLKCVLTAKFAGVTVDVQHPDTKSEEFKKKTPVGTLPVAETKEGLIWQSSTIVRYLASVGSDKNLIGTGIQAAQVDQIIGFLDSNFNDIHALSHLLYSNKKVGKLEQKAADTQLEKVTQVLGHILDVNTFLAGERISVADLTAFSYFRWLFVLGWEPEERKKYRSLTRWFQSISNHKLVKEAVGEIKLKEKKEKKVESTFNLEEWKRVYMNSEHAEACKYFWSKLDVKVNSIWIANFKYNDDLKGQELYVVVNKLRGVQQRLQDFSKTTFGVMAIVGEEKAPEITCLWVFENKQVPKEIQEETDYPMFEWTRMDWKKDQLLVEDYLRQKDTITGKTILDSKTFR